MAAPMRKLLSFSIVILLLSGCSQAVEIPKPRASARGSSTTDQPTLDQLKSRADKLLTQMASDHYKTREKATNKLRKLLKQAAKSQKGFIAYLGEKLKESEDAEVKQRIQGLLDPYLRPWRFWKKLHSLGKDDNSWIVQSIAFNPDRRLIAFSYKPTPCSDEPWPTAVETWNPRTGSNLRKWEVRTDYPDSGSINLGGKKLAAAGEKNSIAIWNLDIGEKICTLKGHKHPVQMTQFNPDGRLLASTNACLPNSSADETREDILIWDSETGKCLRKIDIRDSIPYVCSMSFSPDSKMLAVATECIVVIYNPNTGEKVQTLQGHTGIVYSVAFSPDGSTIASGGTDSTVRIFNITTGQCISALEGHGSLVNVVAFSPDGKMLASADRDWVIRIWSPDTSKCLRKLEGHLISVVLLTFSPDSKMLVSSDAWGNILIWGIPEE
jgi:WD40 repeat protein